MDSMLTLNIDICSKQKINKKIICSDNKIVYYILNYDKTVICFDNIIAGLYRSVIFSFPEKNVLCFSPPKSIPLIKFREKYPIIDDKIIINEMIEGVMINLFYDNRINKWEIATRSSIGGKFSINKDKKQMTLYKMFIHALSGNFGSELNNLPFIKMLVNKDVSYSFVLRHPENKMIIPVNHPELYLVSIYLNKDNNIIYISPLEYEKWSFLQDMKEIIKFPRKYTNIKSYEDIYFLSTNIQQNEDIYDLNIKKGFMLTNMETGERVRIENRQYNEIKRLNNIQPNLQYQYLCFRRLMKNKTSDFWIKDCIFFKKEFLEINEIMEDFIINTHKSYLSLYVLKNKTPIIEKYFIHIYKIHHNIYLPSLKTNNRVKVTKEIVKNYFDNMEPRELLYIMNMHRNNHRRLNI